jgi:hypothetical protein
MGVRPSKRTRCVQMKLVCHLVSPGRHILDLMEPTLRADEIALALVDPVVC